MTGIEQEWEKCTLMIGENVRLSLSEFIQTDERVVASKYVGETNGGILIRNEFIPGIGTEDPDKWFYNRFISWPSIYCGAVKVKSLDTGLEVRAHRLSSPILMD